MDKTGRNQTVMIVDDTDDIWDLLRLQLDMLGYRVMEAASGQEAIELLHREVPKLILMDLNMPGLDGIEATRLIRESLRNSTIIIIAFTALDGREIQQKALAAGCNDYAQKPLEPAQLSSLLHRHLSS
jgi:two-component system, cell cycle response regulator DivK